MENTETNKSKLETFIHREYSSIEKRWKNNNQYLIDHIYHRNDLQEIIENPLKTRNKLFDKLDSLEHTYRPPNFLFNTYPYDEYPKNVYLLTPRQLVRVYLLLETLEKDEFRENLGQLLESALVDPYSEHGGLVVFNEKKEIALKPIKSELTDEKDVKNKNLYQFPYEAISKYTYFSKYHFHTAKEDSSESAGPSQGKIIKEPGDLASCKIELILQGESHNIVITKIKGKNFNIDYYGGEKIANTEKYQDHMVVLDLGNYGYD